MKQQIELSAREAIERLPSTERVDGSGGAVECCLCLEAIKDGEMVTRLPTCGHEFHQQCVTRWLCEGQQFKARRCPLCNSDPLALDSPLPSNKSEASESSPARRARVAPS